MTARVLFVGWDGADWAVLDRLQAEGLLPALSALRAAGSEGTLRSTFPPHSVAAWTSFLTGRPAGSHGIVDFMRCRPGAVFPDVPYTGDDLPGPTLLGVLSGAGRRVLCANLPMTFPPRPLNGLLVGGVFLPEGARFTHPPELQDRLDELGGFPVNGMAWHGSGDLADLFAEAADVTARQTRVFVELLRRERWDVALLAYMAPDRVQHAGMHLLDPAHPAAGGPGGRRRELLAGVYRELDRGLEALLGEASADRVVLASDHGFRPVWRDVVPNRLLEGLGHLRFRAAASRARRILGPVERVARLASRSGMPGPTGPAHRGSGLAARARRALGAEARIDWARTVAYAPSGVCSGIRLNVAGRDPRGALPASRFDATLARLVADLREAADRDGRRYFESVVPATELAPGLGEAPGTPDLFYVPAEGLGVAMEGSRPVRRARRKTGEHRVEGVVVRAGASAAGGKSGTGAVPAFIWEVPRLLSRLAGVEDAAWDARPGDRAGSFALSAEEEASIVEHLQGLGYVE